LALGANGCQDCHSNEANFFKGQRTIDMYDEHGEVVTLSNGRYYGCNPVAFAINTFHQEILSPLVSLGIIVALFLITLHYHAYGPKHIPFVPDSGEVPRFSFLERAVHLFRLISFVILTFTGLIMAFNWSEWQELFFSSPHQMLDFHIWAGVVFIATTVMGIILWFKDAMFASYDRVWVRRLGGYLGARGEVPSGRFNAGQKMFFWYTTIFGLAISVTGLFLVFKSSFPLDWVCLVSTVHNLVAFILIAGVLSHAYLGTMANPGTWRVLIDGYVTRTWAQHHHPNWYHMLLQRGEVKTDRVSDNDHDESDDEESQDEPQS
jgi:formate dehydrogenase subunit gamma